MYIWFNTAAAVLTKLSPTGLAKVRDWFSIVQLAHVLEGMDGNGEESRYFFLRNKIKFEER